VYKVIGDFIMFYTRHIFFCGNRKLKNETGCGYFGGDEAFNFAKTHLTSLNMWGEGKFRASKSGCLGRCSEAPVCVVYPDGVWYSYVDLEDVQEIIDKHLLHGEIVERLRI
jgi:(2Fe-2S) ferredoxin